MIRFTLVGLALLAMYLGHCKMFTRPVATEQQQLSIEQERARAAIRQWFPQAQRCQLPWVDEYTKMHAGVLAGELPPRHLVSVPSETGTADRLTGFVTYFWLAVLSGRAFSSLSHQHAKGFEDVCDLPHFNWALPPNIPNEVRHKDTKTQTSA